MAWDAPHDDSRHLNPATRKPDNRNNNHSAPASSLRWNSHVLHHRQNPQGQNHGRNNPVCPNSPRPPTVRLPASSRCLRSLTANSDMHTATPRKNTPQHPASPMATNPNHAAG